MIQNAKAILEPSKAHLDAMKKIKLVGVIFEVVLVKDYVVYKKWIYEWMIAFQFDINNNQKNSLAWRSYNLLAYFLMVEIPLGSLVAKWATASSRPNR